MLEKLLESIFSKVGEKLLDHGVETVKGNDSKFILETLKRNLKSLSAKASDIEEQIKNGELSGKKKRKREVENWWKEVKIIESDFLALEIEVQEDGFITRFFGGDQATKLKARVDDLVKQSQHFGELLLDAHENRGKPLFMTTSLFGEVFEKNVEKIWRYVVSDKIPIVGIYGMGGIGKTTLAKHIHNLLQENNQYHVFWVTVSHDFRINKLQDDIAKVIGLDFLTENHEDKRAGLLNRALSQMNNSILVLDDVWDNLCLMKVGVQHSLEGCRFIITTRSMDVCRWNGCREIIDVQTLHVDEAWNLFTEVLGQETTLTQQVEEIAKSVAKECDGLPLGIVTIAGSMKGVTDIRVWKNTLTELKETLLGQNDWEDKVFGVLKYSFDRLDPNYKREDTIRNGYSKWQLCFLYCSLYPEDYRIDKDELIKRFISEKLMDPRKKREAEFDQGHAILDKLVNVCLLESTQLFDVCDSVKMHDLVRDMALRITRDMPKFKVLAGLSLKEFPCEEEYWTEDLEKMSLMHNDIREIPEGMSPNCPKLSTLLMNWNFELTTPPDSFFSLMPGLCFLDLSHTNIISLPKSFSELKILNSLILDHCQQLVHVPNLGKLKALRELDLTKTKITQVPQGMKKLVNLKYLSLLSSELKVLPRGLLPRFKYLQYLRLPFEVQVAVEEIESLKQLEKLSCRVKHVRDFNRIILQCGPGNITSFDIVIGEYPTYQHLELDVGVEIDYKRVILSRCSLKKEEGNDVTLLAQDIQHLYLYHCEDLSNCFSDDFRRLGSQRSITTLVVSNSEEIKGAAAAPPHELGVFSYLKCLKIEQCHKIKKLGLPLQDLQNLEQLKIEWCDEIEEIMQLVADEGRGGTVVSLPKLKELHLSDLPKLKSICDQEAKLCCSSIENIRLWHCPKLKKLPLLFLRRSSVEDAGHHSSYSAPPNLKEIEIDQSCWESLEWDHPTHKRLLQPLLKFYLPQLIVFPDLFTSVRGTSSTLPSTSQ